MGRRHLLFVALMVIAGFERNLHAAALPIKSQLLTRGLSRPVFAIWPPGDPNRLFVVEQHAGRIRIIDLPGGTLRSTNFLTISGVTMGSEQGLLGLAFHPNFLSNGYFYVNYTTSGGGAAGHTEITRFKVKGDAGTSGSADPASKTVLLKFDQPESNHNGGWTAFGPDGFLYISTGDGGGGDDVHGTPGNGQSRNTLLGKILRIDVDNGSPYGIPDSNPYKGSATFKPEIWAFGLRNPWRCSFDATTGHIWIGDVGQGTREEVDINPAGTGGLNFGWRVREGKIQNPTYSSEKTVTTPVAPIYDYPHANGNNCIIGGYVYRGKKIPELQGKYIFGDNGGNHIWVMGYEGTNPPQITDVTAQLNPSTNRTIQSLSSFAEDLDHELYMVDVGDGEIYKIVSTAPAGPAITTPSLSGDRSNFLFSFEAAPNQGYTIEMRFQPQPEHCVADIEHDSADWYWRHSNNHERNLWLATIFPDKSAIGGIGR
jgi:glucose/arabinose dehydrogenase